MITPPTAFADVPALQRVLDETELFPSERVPDFIRPFLREPTGNELWLTCEEADVPIGFAYAKAEELTDGTWNMLAIAVAPNRHRSGAGSAPVSTLEAILRDRSQRILIAETSGLPEFEKARNFYRRNGYSEEARIRDFWGRGDDKIVFWKEI